MDLRELEKLYNVEKKTNPSSNFDEEFFSEADDSLTITEDIAIIQKDYLPQENLITSPNPQNFNKFKLPTINLSKLKPDFLKKIKIISELKIFIFLFFIVFSAFFFFTNAKLVFITANDVFENNKVSGIIQNGEHFSNNLAQTEQENLAELEASFEDLKKNKREEQEMTLTMQEELDQKQETHGLNFNILPPMNRLIVPSLNIDVPLIDIPSVGGETFENDNFDDELMKGVVKYPTTAIPGNQGNSLIFGHSSTEWWKHNEYGFVFRNLPKLQEGDKIQVIWDGQLTTYEMIERKIVLPKEVEGYYNEFQVKGESYLTLMGCYPIGSNAKRMMVVAKKINNDSDNNFSL